MRYRAWGYARRVHGLDDAISVETQWARITAYHAENLANYELQAITVEDLGAVNPPRFTERPNAALMNRQMERGDQLIVAAMSAGWVSMRDFVRCYDMWSERGISVHVLDFEDGDLTILRQVARWERQVYRERYTRCHVNRTGPRRRLGYKVLGKKGKKKLVPNPDERRQMGKIVEMIDCGFSDMRVARILNWRGDLAQVSARKKRPWTPSRVRYAYAAEKAIRASESGPSGPCNTPSG